MSARQLYCPPDMLARIATFALALAAFGCSKSETPARLPAVVSVPAAVAIATTTDKADASPSGIDPAELAHVVTSKGTTYVVLSAMPDHERWAKGAPSLVSDDGPVVTRREVDQAALPTSIARLVGRKMRLVGPKSEVCRGTLSAPTLMSRVEPHFGERSRWGGEEIDGVMTPALTHEQVAQVAWDMTSDGKLLVSELVETNGDCQDARFARSSDLPMLETAEGRGASASTKTRAMAEMRKLAAYDQIERSYREWAQAEANKVWTESTESIVTVSEYSFDGAKYVWLSASAGAACEGFSAQLSVFWKVTETNSKQVRFEVLHEGETDFDPQMLVRFGTDKAPSLVGRESFMRSDSKGYSVEDLHVPYLDCPC